MQITSSDNQQAINDFFDGYGKETKPSYSRSILDIMEVVLNSDLTQEYKNDLCVNLKDINQLILNIAPITENTQSLN